MAGLGNTLFGIFAQRQDAQQAAQALIYSTVRSTAASALGLNQNTGKSRVFQLILSQSTVSTAKNFAPSTPAAPTPGLKTIAVTGSQSTRGVSAPLATVTLDVAPASGINGFAQRVSYELRARQSVQHTLAGFTYNEYGLGPGHLEVDCMVIWSSSPNADVNAFINVLETAKRTTPASTTPPYILRFVDTFLGKTLTITQESLSIEQSDENPNYGRIRISAEVLYDADSASPSVSTLTPTQQNAQKALSTLKTLVSLT